MAEPATLTADDVVVLIGVYDRRAGTTVTRGLPAGMGAVIGQDRDEEVWSCRECGELVFFRASEQTQVMTIQGHYRAAHGHTPALLS